MTAATPAGAAARDQRATSGPPWLLPVPAVDRAATVRVGVGLFTIAVVADLALRPGPATIAIGLLTAMIVAVFVRLDLIRGVQSYSLAAGAVVFAAAVGWRTSAWLVPFDLAAAGGLLVLATSMTGGGRLYDLGPDEVSQRVLRLVLSALRGPAWVGRPFRPSDREVGRRAAPVARGLLLAAPIVAVLGLLFASADAVFASVFDLRVDVPDVADHVAVVVLAMLAATTLAVDASTPAIHRRGVVPRVLGVVEATTVLACLVALFALFAGAQIVTALGGAEHVLRTAGLTRAEYARSGFFQLLTVAALTLATLTTMRSVVRTGDERADRRLRVLTFAAIALTVVVVAVAITRLLLYVDAFGLSMLRLYTMIFAGWVGVVFAGLAATVAGIGAPYRWLLSFTVGTALVVLATLNVVNPEALVARHNIAHWQRTAQLDADYLTVELSDDAVPTLLAAGDELDPVRRAQLLAVLCGHEVASPVTTTRPAAPVGWSYNRSRAVADRALAAACR